MSESQYNSEEPALVFKYSNNSRTNYDKWDYKMRNFFYFILNSPQLYLELLSLHNSAGARLSVVMGRLTTVAAEDTMAEFFFDSGQLRTPDGRFIGLPG